MCNCDASLGILHQFLGRSWEPEAEEASPCPHVPAPLIALQEGPVPQDPTPCFQLLHVTPFLPSPSSAGALVALGRLCPLCLSVPSAEGHLFWWLCLPVPWHPAVLCEKQQPSPNFSEVCENWRDLPPPPEKKKKKTKKKRPGAGAFLGAENVKVKGEKLFGGSHHWLLGVSVQQRFQRDPLCH